MLNAYKKYSLNENQLSEIEAPEFRKVHTIKKRTPNVGRRVSGERVQA